MIGGILAIMSMNIVDTFYVGQLGANELAAMSFTIPVVGILLSLAFGIGIGASSVIARAIGSGERSTVQAYCTQSLAIAFIVAISFAVIGFQFIEEIFYALGAPQSLIPLIREFMDVWFLGSFIVIIPMVGNSAIRAAGNTKLPSIVMISVAIVNMLLDPLLIFGLLGFPELGLKGAALSTIIAYAFAFIIGMYLLISKFNFLSLSACKGRIKESWQKILKIAIPAVSTNLIAPLSGALMTWFVAKYGAEAVAGLGVAIRIESLFLVIIMGLSSIMGPFVGQNWGAERYDRAFQALFISFKFVTFWSLTIACILWLFASPLSALFADEKAVVDSATQYLHIIPVSYMFLGLIMLTSAAANGIGTPLPSLLMSLLRLLVLYVPLAWVLGDMYGLNGIYAATSLANIVVGIGAFFWYQKRKASVLS